VAQKEQWRVPLGGFFNGGVLSTAGGLVFQGTSGGHLVAYDARTGRVLRDIDVGTGIMAAPASYSVRGRQYVVVLAGYGGAMLKILVKGVAAREYQNEPRIIAFELNGRPVPLPARVTVPALPAHPYAVHADQATVARGKTLYLTHCARCHGGFWEGVPSSYPDLTRIPPGIYAAFTQIVLGGALQREGMASFADVLKQKDVAAIEAYLQTQTSRLIAGQRARSGGGSTAVPY
jgi:quinohemoprotein ethanol dehydrogenase